MSHFTVLVIGDNVEKQLQPFHEYECTGIEDEYVVQVPAEETPEELQAEWEKQKAEYPTFEQFMSDYHGYENVEGVWGRKTNPNRQWDWWVVGGRWTGFFKMKEKAQGALGEASFMGSQARPGWVDVIRKGDVDFEFMRNEVANEAAKSWELVNSIIADLPQHESWEAVRTRITEIDEARKFYHDQPRLKAIALKQKEMGANWPFGIFMSLEDYCVPKEQYIQSERNGAISTFAVVKDSQWFQKGKMGWFGFSSKEMTDDQWNEKFAQMLDELPDDTLLTLVDCHI